MIRTVSTTLKFANPGKRARLDAVGVEALRVLNVFVDMLWSERDRLPKYPMCKTETWLSARMQSRLSKQAGSCIRSQRKARKGKRFKPVITELSFELDERFGNVAFDQNSFDGWLHVQSLGNKIILELPFKKHKHFNKYQAEGWTLKKSFRLRKVKSQWFLDLYFEKEAPPKVHGRALGLDCGYKKLLATSDGYCCGVELQGLYEKASRKFRGSKAHRRAILHLRNEANRSVKQLDLDGVASLVIEKLRYVKHRSRFSKKFNNKLQYWSYRNVSERLQDVCERTGRSLVEVNPAYSSQTCSSCGHVDRNSRQGEHFLCTRCGLTKDADLNAAEVILQRGMCSSPTEPATTMVYH